MSTDNKEIPVLDERRILMFPGEIFEEEINTTRDVGNWNKLSHPVIEKSMEWEAYGPYGFMGLHRDDADNNWKMWYMCTGVNDNLGEYRFGMAHSEDGLRWTKHENPLELRKDIQPGSVVIKSGLGPDDHRIFMMQYARKTDELPGRVVLSKSKDGINFEPVTGSWDTSWWEGPSDVIQLLWDDSCGCFRAYFKQWRVCGTTENGEKVDVLFAALKEYRHDEANSRYIFKGHSMWPVEEEKELVMIYDPEDMEYEGDNKYPLGKSLFMHRVVSSAKSRDFINWEYQGPALLPAEGKIADQFYGMSVIRYQEQYVGLPLLYNGVTGEMETGLAYSQDGVEFSLLTENPLVKCGEEGEWDGGMVLGFGDVLQVDDRLSLYFGAISRVHDAALAPGDTFSIGRAWNRLDGFCALTGGTVITKPLYLKNGKLHINAEGIINIKIDDEDGYTLTDFEWGGSRMDLAICHPQMHSDVPYKLEFTVKDGSLYSFWSGDTCTSKQ